MSDNVIFKGTIGSVTDTAIPQSVDVVVVGSGGSGLMAAMTAAVNGRKVLVLESEEVVGGATGVSAGAAWVPAHGFAQKHLKSDDTIEKARTYMYGDGRDKELDHDLVEKFLEEGPKVARYIEEHTHFGWIPTLWPDYRSDIPGASTDRALFPGPFSPKKLGDAARYVRPALTTGMAKNPLPFWMLNGLDPENVWLAGPALVGALLEASLRYGADVRINAPVHELIVEGDTVTGVRVNVDGDLTDVKAKNVILATGGFETSDELTGEHLGAPFGEKVSPKGHNGIAVQLAEQVGADLTGMGDAWYMPGVQLPGETLEGENFARILLGERSLPHSIVVNMKGRRFANEALPYDQFGRIMHETDEATGEQPNSPAWFVFDQTYWEKFGVFGTPPGGEVPSYIVQANSISELAEKTGMDKAGLLETIDTFNGHAREGHDPEFGRGKTLFDRYFGEFYPRLGDNAFEARFPSTNAKMQGTIAKLIGPVVNYLGGRTAENLDPEKLRDAVVPILSKIVEPVMKSPESSVLGPVEKAPYYAIRTQSSALGTVGGPKTDAYGHVLRADGSVVEGLFSSGNAGGAPTKGFYGGAGGTISLGLVFGYLAGVTAAGK